MKPLCPMEGSPGNGPGKCHYEGVQKVVKKKPDYNIHFEHCGLIKLVLELIRIEGCPGLLGLSMRHSPSISKAL